MQTTSKINKFLMVITLLSGSFITAFSETLLNNGFPTIMQEVHVSEMTVQWLSTGYMLAAGVTMPLAAYLTNTIKLRHLFTTTMSLFLTGTIIAAAAPNFPILLIGRLIEGGGRWCQYAPYSQRFVLDFFTPTPGNCYGISRDHH